MRTRRRAAYAAGALVAAAAYATLSSGPVVAAAGDGPLDPAFDGDGRAVADVGYDSGAHAVAVQPDGKVIVAGTVHRPNPDFNRDFAVARLNADGSPDTTFGSGGTTMVDVGSWSDEAYGVAIDPAGGIVVAGFSTSTDTRGGGFAVVRLTPAGALDESFGVGGVVVTATHGLGRAYDVAVRGDGRIYLAGEAGTGSRDFAVVRYQPDGSLDGAFGGDGVAVADVTGGTDFAESLVLQGDKVVAAGVGVRDTMDFALLRLDDSGSVDTAFGEGGAVLTDIGNDSDHAHSVALDAGGRLVVAGSTYTVATDHDFAVARYTSDGALDPSFSQDGVVATDVNGDTATGPSGDEAWDVAVDGDNTVTAVGRTSDYAPRGQEFGIARYGEDGSLDTAFNGSGKAATDFAGSTDAAYAVALQHDGKPVVAGVTQGSGYGSLAVARYLVPGPSGDRDGDGMPDTTDPCPDSPEDVDGVQDDDGCPESPSHDMAVRTFRVPTTAAGAPAREITLKVRNVGTHEDTAFVEVVGDATYSGCARTVGPIAPGDTLTVEGCTVAYAGTGSHLHRLTLHHASASRTDPAQWSDGNLANNVADRSTTVRR